MAELGWSSGGGAVTVAGGLRPSVTDVGAELLFEKVLTPCDATSRGRIVLPKVTTLSMRSPNVMPVPLQQLKSEHHSSFVCSKAPFLGLWSWIGGTIWRLRFGPFCSQL